MKLQNKALFLTAAVLAVTLTGCKTGNRDAKTGYTYNTYLETKPKTWNVHTWETNDESYIPAFTEIGFYDLKLNDTKDGYEIVTEMAAAMPQDVTADVFSEEIAEQYGYQGIPGEGSIWDIELNPNACWEDGQKITADDYVQSMERQLNNKMVNFRADSYYSSSLVIANAEKYFKQHRSTLEPLYNYVTDSGAYTSSDVASDGYLYFNIHAPSPYPGSVFSGTDRTEGLYVVLNNRSQAGSDALELAAQRITDAAQYYCWKYADHEGDYKSDWDEIVSYSKLSSIKSEMLNHYINLDDFDEKTVYVRTTKDDSSEDHTEVYSQAKLKADLRTVVNGLARGGKASKDFAWKLPLFGNVYNDYDQSFDGVGIVKVNDYKLRLFLARAITELDLKFSLSSNWLVRLDLYDKLTITTSAGLRTTGYATPNQGVSGYMSYGPYKLTKFEAGKAFTIEKNDKWYGYTDGQHVGQYQMTGVYTRIITDHNTALQEFERGNLDDFALNRNDMKTYGNSSRLTSTYESYTQKISINSNRAKLLGKQTEQGVNKTVLANYYFRKGLSLAMDRNNFASQATAGSKGFTSLLNDLYLTDVESGEMYRNTAQGKNVYNMVYDKMGGTNPKDAKPLDTKACGFNLSMASWYVAEGLKQELASTLEGHINKGDNIKLEFRVYDNESESTIEMLNFIRKSFSNVVSEAVNKLRTDGVLGANENFTITIDAVKDEDYYNTAHNGNYELIFSTWGGAAINPIGLMQVYCDSTFTSNCEYGFKGHQNDENFNGDYLNPNNEFMDAWVEIDLDGNGEIGSGERKTYHNWWSEINEIVENDPKDSPEYAAKHKRILDVLSNLEAAILLRFEAIPLVARASASLNSFKIENGSPSYINLIGYGGIRHMTFNYNDGEWEQFVKDHGGNLSNLYKN